MQDNTSLEILLVTPPGFEEILRAEVTEKGFKKAKILTGGVLIKGGWPEVYRANLQLRGASKVLVRLGSFRAFHLSELDKKARQFPWNDFLNPRTPIRVDVSTSKSKIYHKKAAVERIERALEEILHCEADPEAGLQIKVRLFKDICTISLDSSGEGLHKRGSKEALNKAPLRETLAALSLRACGFKGKEPVIDPMCGSGTFILEAAEIASRLDAGRNRAFAFETLKNFDPKAWKTVKEKSNPCAVEDRFFGFDRDKGAISFATANAERAQVSAITSFTRQTLSNIQAPKGPAGLMITNPPYGTRIGDQKKLLPLYQSLGNKFRSDFNGWRLGLITNSDRLAHATGLDFKKTPIAFSHGGINVKLYQTEG